MRESQHLSKDLNTVHHAGRSRCRTMQSRRYVLCTMVGSTVTTGTATGGQQCQTPNYPRPQLMTRVCYDKRGSWHSRNTTFVMNSAHAQDLPRICHSSVTMQRDKLSLETLTTIASCQQWCRRSQYQRRVFERGENLLWCGCVHVLVSRRSPESNCVSEYEGYT